MTKAEIITKVLTDMELFTQYEPAYSDEPDDEEIIVAELRGRLPDDVEIKTCEDFKRFGVECCETCHGHYAHYEMSVIDVPGGCRAWVCCPVKRAIYPDANVRH